MSDPVATPTDLETYLGLDAGSINEARATLLLAAAQRKCERIVNPCPPEAADIVLEVAGRAYANVTSARQMSQGSASVSFGAQNSTMGVGGLYLSRSNKAELRLIAGRGSAFSADTMPTGTNAAQLVTVTATAGTFTLSFQGHTTSDLAFDAAPGVVQTALEALPSIGAGNVAVTGALFVTFVNRLGASPMPLLTGDGSGLAGGTVSIVTVVDGVLAPGAGLPPWGRDYGLAPQYGW
jgi:hypothetical protein